MIKEAETFDIIDGNVIDKPNNKEAGPIHWVGLYLCIIVFIIIMAVVMKLTSVDNNLYIIIFGILINKSVLSGIISQIQVILSVFMALYPMNRGFVVAVILNTIEAASALMSALLHDNMNALPGIVMPVATIFVISIIFWYSKSLKKQMGKVIQNNAIIQENEKMLYQLAYYDSLTGLPNRKMMFDEIDRLADSYMADNKSFKFLYLDLDDFNKVNDIVSHSVGDMVLAKIVQRWRSVVRREDILGRLGGDEFGLVITSDMEEDELKKYINRFRSALKETLILNKKELIITASYGIVKFPNDGTDVTELMRNADIAMNRAKAAGKNEIRVFDYEMHEGIIQRLQIESGLLNCIKNNELFVVFQPLYQCNTRKLRGFEALARWKYPGMGLVSPALFIPVAEQTGLIVEIGKWILSYSLKKFMTYQRSYQYQGVVAINISVVQLVEPNFVPMIKEALCETGFDSSLLELEIIESVMISCPEKAIKTLNQLRELGIRISLDDFGTGYASLSYLQILPIDILKIDKSFIDKICEQDYTNNIVGNIISLAHQLGIEVLAEGVELEEQLRYLTEQNCDFVQGYLLSRPLDEEKLIDLIKTV